MRKYTYLLLLLAVTAIILYGVLIFAPVEYKRILEERVVQAILVLVVGVLIIEYIGRAILRHAREIGTEAFLIRNVVLLLGYILVGVIVAGVLGVSGEPLIASATFSGLIIGLGMQPVLANFFAGLIILGTGFLKPGKKIKIASTSFPISPITFPAYKSFSRDTIIPLARGTVVEIGLMYTKILLDTGELIKLSNSMIFGNAIVFEEDEVFEPPRVQVRYEFPILFEPNMVLHHVREALRDLSSDIDVFIEEQSDKNFYIVLVVARAPEGVKVREFRSNILSRLISVHRNLEATYSRR